MDSQKMISFEHSQQDSLKPGIEFVTHSSKAKILATMNKHYSGLESHNSKVRKLKKSRTNINQSGSKKALPYPYINSDISAHPPVAPMSPPEKNNRQQSLTNLNYQVEHPSRNIFS